MMTPTQLHFFQVTELDSSHNDGIETSVRAVAYLRFCAPGVKVVFGAHTQAVCGRLSGGANNRFGRRMRWGYKVTRSMHCIHLFLDKSEDIMWL